MFSSNPFQQFPSTIHVFPSSSSSSSFFDLEKDGVHFNHPNPNLNHNNNHFVTGDCFFHAPNCPVVTDNTVINRQQEMLSKRSAFQYCDDNSNLLESVIYPASKKKMPNIKKHGHSKIHTAQGPRDRRVRLSIEVARKFFYLQDLLGFDKASKTLDWLFNKSRTAIRDLVEEMKQCSSSGATDQCEVVFQETIKRGLDDDEEEEKKTSSSLKYVDVRKKKAMRKYKSGLDVNQSRAAARARARERTKEKLHTKKLDNESKKVLDDCYRPVSPLNVTSQSTFWSTQIETQSSEHNGGRICEYVTGPKISMPSAVLYGYPQNLMPNDLSSQIKYTSFLNLH
uniref:transcription factor CYCLOIDEA-like n=1 Tax=Erigeron canadensis TaxID=72917 RepID=UPI001CB8A0A2|nr:transcription factor CYCLOIDEA-like [Erigeron canadensis]